MMTATITLAAALASIAARGADETTLRVDADRVIHRVSPYLYGACIEDVNHEIYGGLYSQMIFGESFQEPPRPLPLKGFRAFEGEWSPRPDGSLDAAAGSGPKLVADDSTFTDGEVSVQIRFDADQGGNAGMVVRLDRPGKGPDAFIGYEVSLESSGFLTLGRHRMNWEPLRHVPCPVPIGRWIALDTRMTGAKLEILVDGKSVLTYEDTEHPLARGGVALRTWQRPASYRNLAIKSGDSPRKIRPFERLATTEVAEGLSGMWSPVRKNTTVRGMVPHQGPAIGKFSIEPGDPFVGRQSQRITQDGGVGVVGIENRGLNRWGMNFVAGQPYEGYLWARAEKATPITLSMETADGSKVLAETQVEVRNDTWTRYDFRLTPSGPDATGRFAVLLKGRGSVVLGHVFLQPGEWGRFRGLPVRKDVAEGLINQGIAVLRYGGSMINHPQYRWKEMIGPRDRRPTHAGTWYAHSTNGWGIFDFLNFCEAAGFLAIPDINVNESPQDMADFIEYVNGPVETEWGRKRAADGHPEPYRLRHLQLGNEEAVNDEYFGKFQAIAEAIWARDPNIILVVGDFAYSKVIVDPYKFEGGAAASSLAAHRKILELAKSRGREVWFDIHVWTDHPPEPHGLRSERSYIEQLGKIAPGARFKVVFFEYNSGNHRQKRALSNALATIEAERIGDLMPIACVANCLQPDSQNDNGWDQGMLFLNPSKVWLQPPGHLISMSRRGFQPLLVQSGLTGRIEKLSVNARRSEDGKTLVLQVVNWDDQPRPTRIIIEGFTPSKSMAAVETLDGPLESGNTADEPDRIKPRRSDWMHEMAGGPSLYSFPARSITMIRVD